MEEQAPSKPSVRKRAEEIKPFRCKKLIAVLENPTDVKNIGTVKPLNSASKALPMR